ncbi:MAG: sodium:calcium antiporter [Hyphomicrobiaceae bacterium]
MVADIGSIAFGLALVLFFAGRLVQGTLAFARGFGLSAFVVSVLFLGFDPENLAVGAVGTYEGAPGIAMGTIVGSAMVAIALAFGVTALIVPLRFEQAPRSILVVPIMAMALVGLLAWDGELSRVDGLVLLTGYLIGILYLVWLSRRGVDIQGAGLGKKTEKAEGLTTFKAVGLLLISLAMIVAGSELLVRGARDLIEQFGLSQTLIGMTVIALAISIEEIARELPAAWKGHPEIAFGNVAGSVLAFFLFNAGIIALIRPLPIDAATANFYLPVAAGTVVLISALLLLRRVPRWAGALLVAVYIGFAVGGYALFGASPATR